MAARIDLLGQRFSRLLVTGFVRTRPYSNGAVHILWECQCDCGKKTTTAGHHLRAGRTQSCGCLSQELKKIRGEKSRNWQGGRSSHQGYIFLIKPEHPAANNGGYVQEHRLVMEEHLGRFLYPEETIHHKNGVRSDNCLENLELWASKHPAGQRVSDLLVWAKEILQRYNGASAMVGEEPDGN